MTLVLDYKNGTYGFHMVIFYGITYFTYDAYIFHHQWVQFTIYCQLFILGTYCFFDQNNKLDPGNGIKNILLAKSISKPENTKTGI